MTIWHFHVKLCTIWYGTVCSTRTQPMGKSHVLAISHKQALTLQSKQVDQLHKISPPYICYKTANYRRSPKSLGASLKLPVMQFHFQHWRLLLNKDTPWWHEFQCTKAKKKKKHVTLIHWVIKWEIQASSLWALHKAKSLLHHIFRWMRIVSAEFVQSTSWAIS